MHRRRQQVCAPMESIVRYMPLNARTALRGHSALVVSSRNVQLANIVPAGPLPLRIVLLAKYARHQVKSHNLCVPVEHTAQLILDLPQ
jgi:hypothetical protein